jgi:hypothetical protein
MDKVRLGRILGAGARHAARTAYDALDAATAPDPNPRPAAPQVQRPTQSAPRSSQQSASARASQILQTAAHTARTLEASKKQAKATALAPLKKASRVLGLEITGSFFLLFAVPFAVNAWKLRSGLHAGDAHRPHFFFYCVLAILFGYFSASSFHRAYKKS